MPMAYGLYRDTFDGTWDMPLVFPWLACLGPKESLHHHLHASPIQGQRILQSTAKRKENTKKMVYFFDLLERKN